MAVCVGNGSQSLIHGANNEGGPGENSLGGKIPNPARNPTQNPTQNPTPNTDTRTRPNHKKTQAVLIIRGGLGEMEEGGNLARTVLITNN